MKLSLFTNYYNYYNITKIYYRNFNPKYLKITNTIYNLFNLHFYYIITILQK